MKKIKTFLNTFELENLEQIMLKTVIEFVSDRDGAEEILENESDSDCENILGPFLKNLNLNLEEFGFEKDNGEKFGFSWESSDDDNTFAFESLAHDMCLFVTQVQQSVELNDGVVDESIENVFFEQLWNDDPY
jgi:hypothetical protein